MKGCAVAGLRDLILFIAAMTPFAWSIMQRGGGWTDALGPSLLCGAILWIGLKLLFGIAQPLREKRMLARRHEQPVDGELCAVSGTIHAAQPLRAPLTGISCAAFRYTILAIVGQGKHRNVTPIYEGIAVTPSTIRTPSGSYRLLAVPTFDFESELLDGEVTQRIARTHLDSTTFEKPRPPRSKSRLAEEWSDDDGAYRYEVSHIEPEVPLDECSFEEFVVKQDEEVTLFGRYSLARAGLVADANWAHKTRVMKGPADLIIASLSRRVRNYFVWGLVITALSGGVYMLLST